MYKLKSDEIENLIEPMSYALVTDKITVEGMKIGFMYREKPWEKEDSRWRFLSGTEDDEYLENPKNSMMFEVNTIANYDRAIIPYLKSKIGVEFERIEGTDEFKELE